MGGATDKSTAIPVVELQDITKVFPGVVANDGVNLELHRGEIHCLLGENGAGKSTLMQILAGIYRPDAGRIFVEGLQVEIKSPQDAIALGIGMVYQHPTLVSTFTVLDNLLLGSRRFRLDRKRARDSFSQVAERLSVELDPEAVAGRLPLARQQQVEIVKAIWSGSAVLILDEPTAMLAPQEVDRLGRLLVSLKTQGLAVVVITHKLHEALAFGDRITVLCRGRVAGSLNSGQLADAGTDELQAMILRMMFGEETPVIEGPAGYRGVDGGMRPLRAQRDLPAETVLRLEGVSVRPGPQEVGIQEVSFSVRVGEIFGLAGVDGNGQRELAEAIAGQRDVSHGQIWLDGHNITGASVGERQRLGLGYVTDDRLGEGMVASLPLSLNLLLKRIGEQPFWSRSRRMLRAPVEKVAEGLVDEFDIRAAGVHTRGGTLSGGNAQKMILARELSFGPKIVVYNKPTYGLDFKTTLDIRKRVRDLATDDGVAAVVMSPDLDELVGLCDRIGVMFGGRLTGVVDNHGSGVEQRVGELMVGGGEGAS